MQLRWVQRVDADAATIWEACATPTGLARWQADVAEGEVRTGGHLHLEWPQLGVGADLDVELAAPPRRLAMRNGDALVDYEIADGAVTLTHSGLSEEDDLAGFASSWRCALSVLAHSVERQRGVARAVSWHARAMRATPALAHALFTDPDALAAWLGPGTGIGPLGSAWHVDLPGKRLSGQVLCHVPGRDVCLAYDDGASAVVLRTLPAPDDARERVIAIQHSLWGPALAPAPWAGALDRLAALVRRGGDS